MSQILKTIVVDDEALARRGLKHRLKHIDDIVIIHVTTSKAHQLVSQMCQGSHAGRIAVRTTVLMELEVHDSHLVSVSTYKIMLSDNSRGSLIRLGSTRPQG